MNKQPSRIGLYLVLLVALVAGYFYLNNQVVSQSSYTQKQLEQALEDNRVVDATIQQNREVPTGAVISRYHRFRSEKSICDGCEPGN